MFEFAQTCPVSVKEKILVPAFGAWKQQLFDN